MYEPHFHVGILVKDIEAAAADFIALLGVEFEPVHAQQVGTGDTVRLCYSLQGPPYLELMEMTGPRTRGRGCITSGFPTRAFPVAAPRSARWT